MRSPLDGLGWVSSRAGRRRNSSRAPQLERLEDRRLLTALAEGEPSGDFADYVIITTDSIVTGSDSLDAFVRHKHDLGLSTYVATERDWGGGIGDGAAENIRVFLASHYHLWGIDYVLIIGDPDPLHSHVPMKVTRPYGAQIRATDYYYGDLDSNWDSNGDGRFGEWDLDFTTAPDQEVFVGRMPFYPSVTTFAQLDAILRRTIAYENTLDPSWRNDVLFAMAVLRYANENGSGDGAIDNVTVAEATIVDILDPNGFGHRFLTEKEGLTPVTAGDAGVADAVTDWSDPATPYGIVAWSAHGAPTFSQRVVWSTDTDGDAVPDSGEFSYPNLVASSDATRLDPTHPPVFIMGSCDNGTPTDTDNLGYRFLRDGAIATYSASGQTFAWGPAWHDAAGRDAGLEGFTYHIIRNLVEGYDSVTTGAAIAWVRTHTALDDAPQLGWRNKVSMNLYGDPSVTLGAHLSQTDLVGAELNLDRDNLQLTGGVVDAPFTVQSLGVSTESPFYVEFVLSDDHDATLDDIRLELDPSDPAYIPGSPTRYRIPALGAGESYSAMVRLRVPDTDPFATDNDYLVGMIVDTNNDVDEIHEWNNANRGLLVDGDDVYYVQPASLPFQDGFETGSLGAPWRALPGDPDGRIRVTDEFGPFEGGYHVVVDHVFGVARQSLNKLELHVDAGSFEQLLLTYHNREWSDTDDDDYSEVSFDSGDTWTNLNPLTGAFSTDVYQTRYRPIDVNPAHTQDIVIRFHQQGTLPVPWGGMAFDDIRVSNAQPDLLGTGFTATARNIPELGGILRVDASVRNQTAVGLGAFNIRFYLSADEVIDPAHDQLLYIDPIDVGHYDDLPDHSAIRIMDSMVGTRHVSPRLAIPTEDPFDMGNAYYVGMVVDADDEVDELSETNNSNRGAALDRAPVTYVRPAAFPLMETWETGRFSDGWEALPAANGQIVVTSDHDPYAGGQHLVMQRVTGTTEAALNQLILHIDLAGQSGVELAYVNREWDNPDDPQDQVAVSVDGGLTWHEVTRLHGPESTDRNTVHRFSLDDLGLIYSDNTLIRFQQLADGAGVASGMALDNVRVGHESTGPQIVAHRPAGRVTIGTNQIEFDLSEPIDPSSVTLDDIERFSAPDGSDLTPSVHTIRWVDDQHLVLEFAGLSSYGPYTLVLGADIRDAAGNAMDQDGDGLNGELPDDLYALTLVVGDVVYAADMNTDPGWTLDSGSGPYRWSYGLPAGHGSQGGDPPHGWDGPNVIGYNLSGDYASDMALPEFATTPDFDASGHQAVQLDYLRWLGIDTAERDKATVEISRNGVTWDPVWSNPNHPLLDDRFVLQALDVSAVADDEPSLQVRWSMGPTDTTTTYYGWNIDNVRVTGIPSDVLLPHVRITDDQGLPDDHWISFGDHNVTGDSGFQTVTLANTGTAPLAIVGVELDNVPGFSLTWDADGTPPTAIPAGESRVATIQFNPSEAGVYESGLLIRTSDPSVSDQEITVRLTGNGVVEPTYGWADAFGSVGFDAALSMAIDGSGSIYLAGLFEGTVDFDPSPAAADFHQAIGGRDAFVTKLAADGTWAWTWTAGGVSTDAVNGLDVDDDGNVVITGEFAGSVDFDNRGSGDPRTSNGSSDVFVTRLSSSGDYKWTRTFGGIDADTGCDVALDASGNAYLVGEFRAAVDFDPGGVGQPRVSQGLNDVFLLRLNENGRSDWVRTFGGSAWDIAGGVGVYAGATVTIDGLFFQTVDFDPSQRVDLHTSQGLYDAFVVQLSTDGVHQWAQTFGGAKDEEVTGISVDEHGNIYVAGGFQDTVMFDPQHQAGAFTSQGSYDAFVTQLRQDGAYGWTHVIAGPAANYARAVAAGPHSTVAVTGSFQDAANFDPQGAGDAHVSNGSDDVFVTQIGEAGTYIRTRTFGGSKSDIGYGTWLDGSGAAWAAGFFQDVVDFDPGAGQDLLASAGSADGFLSSVWQAPQLSGRIRGVKWADANQNGVWDVDEERVAGWTVFLDANQNGTRDGGEVSTQTAIDGRYEFLDLPPGDYTVAEEQRTGWITTYPLGGSHSVIVQSGVTRDNVSFGNYQIPVATINAMVWYDQNGDGIRDASESGIGDVRVHLVPMGNGQPQTTMTDPAGNYQFTGVTTGDYYLEFDSPQGDYFAAPNQGKDDTVDSDVDPLSGRTPVFFMQAGQTKADLQAGMARAPSFATLGSIVWRDDDGNGIRGDSVFDALERGFEDVEVRLETVDGTLLRTTTTDASGRYQFSTLIPGEYVVEFVAPSRYLFSPADQGVDDALDSDVNVATGRTGTISLAPGEHALNWDAGLTESEATITIGNRVWIDQDADGAQGAAEPGLAGATILLRSAYIGESGVPLLLRRATTDIDGYYQFTDLSPGTYLLEIDVPDGFTLTMPNWIDNDSQDSDFDWITRQTTLIPVPASLSDDTWDAGMVPAETIIVGDRVWLDDDGNGIQDPGEPGILGVNLTLRTNTGEVGQVTTTDAAGRFAFRDVDPGEYHLYVTPPSGYFATVRDAGDNDRRDSDIDPILLRSNSISLASGTQNLDIDVGLVHDDFGDAPEPLYPTRRASSGPHHTVTPGFYLGTGIDAEGDGQPNIHATGDDEAGADEDGVTFLTELVPGYDARIQVVASATGALDVWIDFKADGWTDADDRVFAGQLLHAGTNTLTFAVPPDARFGATYARFRLSKSGGLAITGPAADGEVEDYELLIGTDYDADGVPDKVEDNAPNDGDGNMDGTPDRLQSGIASIPDALTGIYVTLVANASALLHGVRSIPGPEAPTGMSFPRGLFEYQIAGLDGESRGVVKMLTHELVEYNTYYEYGQRPGFAQPLWFPFIYHGDLGAELGRAAVEVHVQDGKQGDLDLAADGVVQHRGGPGLNTRQFPWQHPTAPVDSNNDGIVTPLDVLIIINLINLKGSHALQVPPTPPELPPPYFDVSGDNYVSPIDALIVINDLNQNGSRPASPGHGQGEGEPSPIWLADLSPPTAFRAVFAAASAGTILRQHDSASHATPADVPWHLHSWFQLGCPPRNHQTNNRFWRDYDRHAETLLAASDDWDALLDELAGKHRAFIDAPQR